MAASIISYADIAQLIGESLALHLSKERGGRALYIPSPRRLGPQTPVVILVGIAAAESLAQRYGGTHIDVPLGPGKRARVWELREIHKWTIARIAAEMRCTERTVYATLAGPRPRSMGAAAPVEEPPLLAYMAKG